MSHFTVAVIYNKEDKNLEDILIPYQEYDGQDYLKKYLKFEDHTDEVESEWENLSEEKRCDYETIELFNHEYCGYEKIKDGTFGFYYNPNSKWDWYSVGGRWSGLLINKAGKRVDEEYIKNIDFKRMKLEKEKELREYWEGNKRIQKKISKEDYIKENSNFITFAVVTPDGKWHEKGSMGWFGYSNETKEISRNWDLSFYDKFIKNENKELTMTIVDCHI